MPPRTKKASAPPFEEKFVTPDKPFHLWTKADKVMAFIVQYCKVPEGPKVGQPLTLAPFQIKFIRDVYDNPAGTSMGILSMPRKNSKTATIATLVLAHVCGPMAQQNSQVVSGAMSREQAAIVFNLAVKMIYLEPRLEAVTHVIPSQKTITGLRHNVEYKALSAEATTAHGLSPVLAILDEVGQVRGPTSPFVEAITTSQGAHDSPLLIAISTQAPSDADMLSIWIDDALRSGDPHIVCHLYAADANCDLLDKEQWRKANPALGLFRSERDLETQLAKASRLPALEASARNLLLNQRVSQRSLWLAPSVWKDCNGEPDLEVFREFRAVIGLDLSARVDLTAAVVAACDPVGIVHLLPFVFTPLLGLAERAERDRAPYEAWVKSGHLITVPGASIEYDWLAKYLRTALDDLGIEVESVEFDRWRIDVFKAAAERAEFAPAATWHEVGQGYKDFSPRIDAFETALLMGKVRHGGHPLLNMAAANAVLTRDPSGNRKLDKATSTQRIDPLVAAVMASFAVTDGSEDATSDNTLFFVG